jgi:uncharacterized membrane protein YkoI
MNKRTIITISTITVAATLGIAGIAAATQVDDNEQPITGAALTTASAAALAHTGEGRVTDTEIGDEDSFYEVEVTLNDGRQVDVQLDKDFRVVGSAADDEDEAGDD